MHLEPCRCGSTALKFISRQHHSGSGLHVYCTACFTTRGNGQDSQRKAARVWNRAMAPARGPDGLPVLSPAFNLKFFGTAFAAVAAGLIILIWVVHHI